MASVFMDSVDRHLCEHPAILANPEWFRLASEAQTALYNLYQSIGGAHLGAGEPTADDDGMRPEELNASNDD